MTLDHSALGLLQTMSLEQKVGQVFVFTFVSEAQAHLDLRLHPGGFIRLFSDVLTAARQNNKLQAASTIPLLIAADFERGLSPMMAGGSDFCSMMTLGATHNPDLAWKLGRALAEEASAIGVNMNYVPVMDVNINEDNPIINTRSLGGSPELVSRLGAAFIQGHRSGQVLTCAKHFPGHGDTDVDSHTSLSAINASRERMETVELAPFRAAIAAGVDCIMTAHLLIPAYEPKNLPATLSRTILSDLLRGTLGFDGVITSDALEMGAISKNYPIEEATVMAFNAGCDMLIMPTDNRRSVGILLDAVKRGLVSSERLDEAVLRILTMKQRAGILSGSNEVVLGDIPDRVRTTAHRELALEIALSGTTLIHDRNQVLPLKPQNRHTVISLSNVEDGRTYFAEPRSLGAYLEFHLGASVQSVHCGKLDELHPHEFGAADRALAAAAEADLIIVAAFVQVRVNHGSVQLGKPVDDFLDRLKTLDKPVILVSFGSPYIIKQVGWADGFVCAFGPSEACQEAAAMLLSGMKPFLGKMPVELHWAQQ